VRKKRNKITQAKKHCVKPVSIQTQRTQAPANRNGRSKQLIIEAANQSYACVACGFRLRNERNAIDCVVCALRLNGNRALVLRPNFGLRPIIMVARSSDSESELPLYFTAVLFIYFFFSRHTFSDVRKPTSPT